MDEIMRRWTIQDLLDVNDTLDFWDELEEKRNQQPVFPGRKR